MCSRRRYAATQAVAQQVAAGQIPAAAQAQATEAAVAQAISAASAQIQQQVPVARVGSDGSVSLDFSDAADREAFVDGVATTLADGSPPATRTRRSATRPSTTPRSGGCRRATDQAVPRGLQLVGDDGQLDGDGRRPPRLRAVAVLPHPAAAREVGAPDQKRPTNAAVRTTRRSARKRPAAQTGALIAP